MQTEKKTIAKDMASLNISLLEVYNGLRKRTEDIKYAKELSNVAGKYIKGLSVQLEYRKMTGSKEPVEGL